MTLGISKVMALAIQAAIATAQITVNLGTTYQTIDGFGASAAWQAGAIQGLASASQTKAVDLLFSTTSGAGLTILRNRIGSGGTGDSIEPTSPGSATATPKYVWDGSDSGQVWLSKQARALGVQYIYADAWSAPGFMKTNGAEANGGSLCGTPGTSCSTGDWRQAYANMITQYIKDYASAGVTIDLVGFLNEPEYAPNYSSMLSNGAQSASFIPILHSAIAAAGLKTGVTCCDAEGWSDQVTYTQQLGSAGALQYVSRITSHWYVNSCTAPMPNTQGIRVWETEIADLNDPWTSTWYASNAHGEGLYWANQIYQGIVQCQLSAFLYWWAASNNAGTDCLLNLSNGVEASGRLWAFAMWSRYVRPNAVMVASSGAPTNVKTAAFKNAGGSIAVVIINNGGATSTSLSVTGATAGSVQAYYMSNSVSSPSTLSGATVGGGKISLSLPDHSVVTLVISTSGGGSPPPPPPSSSPPSPPPSSTTSHVSTTSPPTTTTPGGTGGTQSEWGQCGGIGYSGPTVCAAPATCTTQNAYYAQCV